MRTGYYDFSQGINYRDDNIAVNELRDAKNVYWRGNLKRRNPYEVRNTTLQTEIRKVAGFAAADVIGVYDHIRLQSSLNDNTDAYFLFVGVDSGGGVTMDVLVVMYFNGGLPTLATDTFSSNATLTVAWTATNPHLEIQTCTLGRHAYFVIQHHGAAVDNINPYMIYDDGGTWKLREVLICDDDNAAGVNFAGVIITAGDLENNPDWDDYGGIQWIASTQSGNVGALFIGNEHMCYYAVENPEVSMGVAPSFDKADAVFAAALAGSNSGWSAAQNISLDPTGHVKKAVSYNQYIFLGGTEKNYVLRLTQLLDFDYIHEQITEVGAYGALCPTPQGVFFVGYDGIYAYDGYNNPPIAKKVWGHIKDDLNTYPTDLQYSSMAYHDGLVWIAFYQANNNEVWVFDPDNIYTDEKGDTHAPMYRFMYYYGNSTWPFFKIKAYENSLYAVYNKELWQLDVDNDNAHDYDYYSSLGGNAVHIPFHFYGAYDNNDVPGYRKVYKQVIFETDAMISGRSSVGGTNSTTDIANLHVNFSRDHGELEVTTTSTAAATYGHQCMDMYYTDGKRAFKTYDIPYTMDGNSLSIGLDGYASGTSGSSTGLSNGVNLYGWTVEYDIESRPKEEIS